MISDSVYLLHHGPSFCEGLMPASEFRNLYIALVCGKPIASPLERQLFIDTGLIHILVVSGAHLHTLEYFIRFLPAPIRIGGLSAYCWLCGFGAPIVRAWFRRVVGHLARPLGGSVLQLELVTIIVTLIVKPDWLFSRSFLMSWLCALALSLPPILKKHPVISFSIYCYLFLFPLAPSAPSTIFCNILVAPVIGGFLFPLCAFTAAWPAWTPFTDGVWTVLLYVLAHLPTAPPAPWMTFHPWLFLYPFALHLSLVALEVPWRRARAFS